MKFAVALIVLAIGTFPSWVGADSSPGKCTIPKVDEPEAGKCKLQELNRLCYDPAAIAKQICIPEADRCPTGADDKGISSYCTGRVRSCPVSDVVPITEGTNCFAWTQLGAKGGNELDVQGVDPPCAVGTGDNSACQWVCLQAPTGGKVVANSVKFLAKDKGSAQTCGSLQGYAAFDVAVCGTPATVGRCAPSWYTWEAVDVRDELVCGRVKNWSHDQVRCAAISFDVMK